MSDNPTPDLAMIARQQSQTLNMLRSLREDISVLTAKLEYNGTVQRSLSDELQVMHSEQRRIESNPIHLRQYYDDMHSSLSRRIDHFDQRVIKIERQFEVELYAKVQDTLTKKGDAVE